MTRLLAVLLLFTSGALVATILRPRVTPAAPPPVVAPTVVAALPEDLGSDEERTVRVFQEYADSVVNVTKVVRKRVSWTEVADQTAGSGSGFVWDTAGHVVTNFHVVADATSVRVTLSDGKEYPATIVGAYADKDVAVLKIEAPASGLKQVTLGTTKSLRVGQKVLAIGNPFGMFDNTLTTGVISGVGRTLASPSRRPIFDVIQTDASINPGNSGGPLLDSSGRLIGMNTAIYSPSRTSAGIGFAVPVDTIASVVTQIIEHGRVIRPGLGVDTQPLRDASGLAIIDIVPSSGAEAAGLKGATRNEYGEVTALGDIIVAIDNVPINSREDLLRALDQRAVGDTLTVGIVSRNGPRRDVPVTLRALPN